MLLVVSLMRTYCGAFSESAESAAEYQVLASRAERHLEDDSILFPGRGRQNPCGADGIQFMCCFLQAIAIRLEAVASRFYLSNQVPSLSSG